MNNHKLVNLSEPTLAQDATTRGYVKAFTRNNFLKLDGTNTMVGDLSVNNHKIINVANPTLDQDAATKQYVDSRKPLITIWAQEVGPLNPGEYEWSFGSGDYTLAKSGYCMPAAGRILRGSICSVNDNGNRDISAHSERITVGIVINGQVTNNEIIQPSGSYSNTTVFNAHIPLAQNDRINFRTSVGTPNATNTIVSLLIELDL